VSLREKGEKSGSVMSKNTRYKWGGYYIKYNIFGGSMQYLGHILSSEEWIGFGIGLEAHILVFSRPIEKLPLTGQNLIESPEGYERGGRSVILASYPPATRW
jgi:hypothetical protein